MTRAAGELHERFARRMRGLRAHHDLTGAELAQRCADLGHERIDRNVIAKVETGVRSLTLDEAAAIAQALGVSLAEMTSPEPLAVEIKVELP